MPSCLPLPYLYCYLNSKYKLYKIENPQTRRRETFQNRKVTEAPLSIQVLTTGNLSVGGWVGLKKVRNAGSTKAVALLRSPNTIPQTQRCVRKYFPLISFHSFCGNFSPLKRRLRKLIGFWKKRVSLDIWRNQISCQNFFSQFYPCRRSQFINNKE